MEHLPSKERLKKFVAGGIAGGLAKTAVAPLDRIKILFQTTNREFRVLSVFAETHRIRTQEGLRAYWKGNFTQMVRIVPYSAIVFITQQFTSYDYFKSSFFRSGPGASKAATLANNFFPGSLAGITAVFFTYPFEVARTRLAIQTTGKVYNGLAHAFVTLARTEGLKGLFRGGAPTMAGIGIYAGISFSLYFSSKELIGHTRVSHHFYFGAISGLIGQMASYPFEIVRKRMISHGFIEKVSKFRSISDGVLLTNARSYFFYVLQHEGPRGLFKGFSMNLIKSPLANGIVHLANETINVFIAEHIIGSK